MEEIKSVKERVTHLVPPVHHSDRGGQCIIRIVVGGPRGETVANSGQGN